MDATLRYGTPQEAGMDPARIESLKQLARGWVEGGIHPALVVLVARRGIICLHEAFGMLRPGEESPLKKNSIFPIASATKPVTAACVLLLVEEGKVGLMRPIREYFPEIKAAGSEEVLVHHLLAHLSGWRDIDVSREVRRRQQEPGDLPPPEPAQNSDIAAYLHRALSTPLACRPGEAMQYCQLNYTLLGELVMRVSTIPIERFAEERIFGPLGMKDSSFVLPPEHRERKVRQAEDLPYAAIIDSEAFESQPWGWGGVHTSAIDFATFAQMLLNDGTYAGRRILSSASVQAMRRNQVPAGVTARWERAGTDGEPVTLEYGGGYGYGLFPFLNGVTPYLNGGLASASSFGHRGATGAYWWADPERDLVGVYLSVPARNVPDDTTWDGRSDIFVDTVTAAVPD